MFLVQYLGLCFWEELLRKRWGFYCSEYQIVIYNDKYGEYFRLNIKLQGEKVGIQLSVQNGFDVLRTRVRERMEEEAFCAGCFLGLGVGGLFFWFLDIFLNFIDLGY